jgi:carbon storage regulator
MLVLTRKSNESVVVGRAGSSDLMLTVTVLEINGGKVRLGFEGDANVPIHRSEVWERIRTNGRPDSPTNGSATPVA